jgi:hypothetical protein
MASSPCSRTVIPATQTAPATTTAPGASCVWTASAYRTPAPPPPAPPASPTACRTATAAPSSAPQVRPAGNARMFAFPAGHIQGPMLDSYCPPLPQPAPTTVRAHRTSSAGWGASAAPTPAKASPAPPAWNACAAPAWWHDASTVSRAPRPRGVGPQSQPVSRLSSCVPLCWAPPTPAPASHLQCLVWTRACLPAQRDTPAPPTRWASGHACPPPPARPPAARALPAGRRRGCGSACRRRVRRAVAQATPAPSRVAAGVACRTRASPRAALPAFSARRCRAAGDAFRSRTASGAPASRPAMRAGGHWRPTKGCEPLAQKRA